LLENNIIKLKQSTFSSFIGSILLIAALVGIILVFIIVGIICFSKRLAKDITAPIQKLTADAARIGAGNMKHILVNYRGTSTSLTVIEDTTNEKEYQDKLRNIALQEQALD